MKKFFRRKEEWIVLKNSADDHQRMSPQNIDHRVAVKFSKVVCAYHCVIVASPNLIHARFKLDDVLHADWIADNPVHPAYDPAQRIIAFAIAACNFLERIEHAILIKSSISQIRLGIVLDLQLPALLSRSGVDSNIF